jgi:hypothetical protein
LRAFLAGHSRAEETRGAETQQATNRARQTSNRRRSARVVAAESGVLHVVILQDEGVREEVQGMIVVKVLGKDGNYERTHFGGQEFPAVVHLMLEALARILQDGAQHAHRGIVIIPAVLQQEPGGMVVGPDEGLHGKRMCSHCRAGFVRRGPSCDRGIDLRSRFCLHPTTLVAGIAKSRKKNSALSDCEVYEALLNKP